MFQKIISAIFILTLICFHINVHLFAQVVEPIENPIKIGEPPTHLSFEFEQEQTTKFQDNEFKVTTVMDTDLEFSEDEIIVELVIKDIEVEYLEIRNKNNLSKNYNKSNIKIFIAYYNKKIRLIDNY